MARKKNEAWMIERMYRGHAALKMYDGCFETKKEARKYCDSFWVERPVKVRIVKVEKGGSK